MKNPVGIMQGRFSLPQDGRIQAFPKKTWQEEFFKSQENNLQVIEWIFEADEWEKNPLARETGLVEILEVSKKTGIKILSVCADYFMDLPFLRIEMAERVKRVEMLKFTISQCARVGVKYLGLPFVDASSIKNQKEIEVVVDVIRQCLPLAQKSDVRLALETDLGPTEFKGLLNAIDHSCVGVNYDIGNSASLGFDTSEELNAYGSRIFTIHIKDRIKGGTTVPLGTGNADFDKTFEGLTRLRYTGPFILQTARGPIGAEVDTINKYMDFLKPYFKNFV